MTVTAQAAPPVLERSAWSDARERVDPSSANAPGEFRWRCRQLRRAVERQPLGVRRRRRQMALSPPAPPDRTVTTPVATSSGYSELAAGPRRIVTNGPDTVPLHRDRLHPLHQITRGATGQRRRNFAKRTADSPAKTQVDSHHQR